MMIMIAREQTTQTPDKQTEQQQSPEMPQANVVSSRPVPFRPV